MPPFKSRSNKTLGTNAFAKRNFSIRNQARNLRTRSSSAGRSVIRAAWTKHKVAPRTICASSRLCKLDVVDLAAVIACDSSSRKRTTNRPCVCSEFRNTIKLQGNLQRRRCDKKPIPAPRNIAGNLTKSRNVHGDSSVRTTRRYICNFDYIICTQLEFHNSHWRIKPMRSSFDSSKMRECAHDSDRSMSAHSKHSGVIEKDHAGNTICLMRFHQHCADKHI
jgi:hypothetical protein